MSTWVFSDIHGNRNLFDQVMAEIGPDDRVYFLGDAIDRGPDGWNILKELLADPRVIFIKGNHEYMMCNALWNYPELPAWSHEMSVWSWNGYEPTISAIEEENNDIVKEVLSKVRQLPTYATYTSHTGNVFWLSHAGFSYSEGGAENIDTYDLIWNREHYYPSESDDKIPDNLYIIHGHTPIPYLVKELAWFDNYNYLSEGVTPGAFFYAGGHKIDVDCGAHFTNMTVLLNLDTFEEKVFTKADRETI